MIAEIPWARLASAPLGLIAVAMASSFWPDRGQAGALFWLGLAAALGYGALALLLNRTRIQVEAGFVVSSHGPIPFPGKRVLVAEITAVTLNAGRAPGDNDGPVGWELALTRGAGLPSVCLAWGPIAGGRSKLLAEAGKALATRLKVPLR
jgi:hypothetical protein